VCMQPVARRELDEDYLEPLVMSAIAGDLTAWAKVWLALDPLIEEIAGRRRVTSRLSGSKDERRNVVVNVMELLQADDFERLRLFHACLLRRDGSARAWLLVVTRRVAIDHARCHAEYLRGGVERRWVDLVPFSEELDEALPVSLRLVAAIDAHRVFACAEQDLEASQVQALRLWVDGDDHRRIAEKLGLGGAYAADLLVRSVVNYLRRLFGHMEGAPGDRGAKNEKK
jgi:hypothetical protein